MYCKSCNAQMPDEAVFCPNCGTPVEEDDFEATGLLIEEDDDDDEATGLLIEEEPAIEQPVYTPPQPIQEPQQFNKDNVNPAYVNPNFNQPSQQQTFQPQQNYYNHQQHTGAANAHQSNNFNAGNTTQASTIEQPTLKSCFKKFWQNYTNFSGRSRRSEYWYVVLANFLIGLVNIIPYVGQGLYALYALAVLVPSLALIVRRLHDLGKEWYNIFFMLIPLAGPIIILVWMFQDSEAGENKFGPNPKQVISATSIPTENNFKANASNAQPNVQPNVCSKCGGKLNNDSVFCPECGERV